MNYASIRNKSMNRRLLPLMMAFSVGISQVPLAFAGPGDINSTNVGTVVQDGTYYNTNGNQTTFVGQNGLLWVQAGTNVRGLEVDGGGTLTGNGGNMLFTNPGGMIRVDGTINASGIMGAGFASSNGGMVTLRADYVNIGQTGQVLAMGTNGGVINLDAGALTMVPGSVISAAGLGGAGGVININASGSVDIQRDGDLAALVDASGKYMGTIDTSVINIQGAVVNNNGIVRANGYVVADGNVVHLYNENIQAPNGDTVARVMPGPIEGTLMTTGSEGGTIRVASTGAGGAGNTGVCIAECAIQKAESYNPEAFGAGEAQNIINNMTVLLNEHNGNINVGPQGVFQADGSSVNLLSHPRPEVKLIDKGFGFYEQAFNEGGLNAVSAAVTDMGEASANFLQGHNGGVILMNARNDVNVLSGTTDGGATTGGLISARGGNGLGYSTNSDGGPQYQTFNAGNGGFISVNAQNDINFAGSAHAFGGSGYQNFRDLTPTEQNWISSSNKTLPAGYVFDNQDMATGGLGGNGGTIAFSYGNNFNNTIVDALNGFTLAPGFTDKTLVNYQQIDASGGHTGLHAQGSIDGQINPYGGLVVFSGANNPNNLANVSVYRGQGPDQYPFIDTSRFGTVVLPNALDPVAISQLQSSNTNFNPDATQLKIDQLQPDELIVGRDTLALLSNSSIDTVWGKVSNAIVRSANPAHQQGGAEEEIDSTAPTIKNFLISSQEGSHLNMDIPGPLNGGSHWLMSSGNTEFTNLSALMILNSSREGDSSLTNDNFWLVGGNNTPAGGFINLISDGRITNNNVLGVTGNNYDGSVALSSNQSVINNGFIGGAGDTLQGASVILKACRDILNSGEWNGESGFLGGEIGANGSLNGGRVELLANNNILNLGKIYADGQAFGGKVLSYAGHNNMNFGLITANGYGFGDDESTIGYGGYVHQHGRNLSANIDLSTLVNNPDDAAGFGPGLIQAAGTNTGGKVFISAGAESCGVGCENNDPTDTVTDAGSQVNGLISDLLSQDNLAGFSTTQNTPLVTVMDTFVDMTRTGSAVNLGHIETRGAENNGGETWLVGQEQVGIGANSSINGVQVSYDDILNNPNPPAAFQSFMTAMNDGNSVKLVAGNVGDVTALSAVFCSNLVPPGNTTGDTPEDGGGYDFPNNFTIPGATDPLNFNVNALFDTYRFRNDTSIPRPPAPLVIGYAQPGMFLAKAYQPVTQEILKLALLEYNRALADTDLGSASQGGQTHKRAFEMARLYLTDAGIDQETATAILEKIQDGTFEAHQNILGVLQAMANPEVEPTTTPAAPTTQPEQPGNVLRQ